MKHVILTVVLSNLLHSICGSASENGEMAIRKIDPKGYIVYCPCMGRFGNQADQFLGSLLFASKLDRTLVLPHWVEYPAGSIRSVQVSFDKYFKVGPLLTYHRVILMDDFMNFIAPQVWTEGKRTAFCYSSREGNGKPNDCNAREGNPFDSFWATFNVNFDSSEFFKPLYFNAEFPTAANEWKRKYPSDKWPVLAFTGAPSPYPPQPEAWPLQQYLHFSDFVEFKANSFIRDNIQTPYVAVHLRNGMDWKNACQHIKDMKEPRNMFDSAQCLGTRFEYGKPKYELCFPPDDVILKDIAQISKKIKAKSVFVATDNDDMKDKIRSKLKARFKGFDIQIVRQSNSQDVHVDLAILCRADFFIGNCYSSFSAFVMRHRENHNLPSQYFGMKPRNQPNESSNNNHDEL